MKLARALCVLALAGTCTFAQTVTIVASFDNTNGAGPTSILQASDGNFYGATLGGGSGSACNVAEPIGIPGCGTVFKLTPSGTVTTLYNFGATPADGAHPNTGLIQATDGNFYGTTNAGGDNFSGTIYRITPGGDYLSLYGSDLMADGFYLSGLIQTADGNFYGTAQHGGANNDGTIFKMTPSATVTAVYSLGPTAATPMASLVQGTDGSFYGTTQAGGDSSCGGGGGCGSVFKITSAGDFSVLYSFGAASTDGAFPVAPLIQANDGNFYGTTPNGGTYNHGTVFKITPQGALTTLYSLGTSSSDGSGPSAGLLQASDGTLYGTTALDGQCPAAGGSTVPCGSIFRITLDGAFTTLHHFGAPGDGAQPMGALIQGKDGNLYGLAAVGGANYYGAVFRMTIPSSDTPAISSTNGVVNGASFQPGISAGSWITISGTNLSSKTDTWDNSIVKGALPTTLDGVSVSVAGQPAYLEYISSTQINAIAPNVPAGNVAVTVTNSNGTSVAVNAQLTDEQPAFFQWSTYAVATRQDFSLAVKNGTFPGTTTVPAAPGDVIILWGTGFGPTSPSTPAGVETPATTTYNTATAVSVTVGGKPATVYGAALAPGYAGLYQVAIQIPASLANGDYPVIASISGTQSPATTLITVQH